MDTKNKYSKKKWLLEQKPFVMRVLECKLFIISQYEFSSLRLRNKKQIQIWLKIK